MSPDPLVGSALRVPRVARTWRVRGVYVYPACGRHIRASPRVENRLATPVFPSANIIQVQTLQMFYYFKITILKKIEERGEESHAVPGNI